MKTVKALEEFEVGGEGHPRRRSVVLQRDDGFITFVIDNIRRVASVDTRQAYEGDDALRLVGALFREGEAVEARIVAHEVLYAHRPRLRLGAEQARPLLTAQPTDWTAWPSTNLN